MSNARACPTPGDSLTAGLSLGRAAPRRIALRPPAILDRLCNGASGRQAPLMREIASVAEDMKSSAGEQDYRHLIATRCIQDDLPLLYSDRDFQLLRRAPGPRSAVTAR